MKNLWKKIKALYHSYRWQVWAAFAAVVGVLFMVLRNLLLRPGPEKSGETTYLPEPPKKLAEKVEKVEKEALVARVEARVKREQDKKKLEEAASTEDGRERRKKLASLLNDL